MASGDTNVTICNQALTLLGSDTISSFSDTTNDAAAVCKVLQASEGQVLFQDLPTMEGAWEKVVSSHTNCIPISCSAISCESL